METPTKQDPVASRNDMARLAEEHHQYSLQLEMLLSKPYPTEEDKLEAVRLKKLKLRLKDRIEALAHGVGTGVQAL
jgi:hypothetical protein